MTGDETRSRRAGESPLSKKKRQHNQSSSDQAIKGTNIIGPKEQDQSGATADTTQANEQHPKSVFWNARTALAISAIALMTGIYQAHIASDALYYSQRAYEFPHFDKTRFHAILGQRFGVIIPFSNVGHTPAYELRIWVNSDIFNAPFPTGEGLRAGTFDNSTTIHYPGVDIEQPVFVGGLLNQSMLDSLDMKENVPPSREIYIWGRIEYVTFNTHVFTQFCLVAVHNAELPPETTWQMTTCPKGNDAN